MELLEKELVFRIVGCAMKVHNTLGHGFREKTYENALCVEFRNQGIAFSQQSRFQIPYLGETVDEFVPDLVVEGRVIVDSKTVDAIIDEHRGKILNYLKATKLKVGVLINFKRPQLQWERLVLDKATK